MKVKELINYLDKFKADAEVKVEILKDNFLTLEKEDILIYIPEDGSIQFVGIKTWE